MPTTNYLYRIWCDTEASWVEAWDTDEPTECPNDAGHSIDTSRIVIIEEDPIGLPANPVTGDQWYNPDDGYFYVYDDTRSKWLAAQRAQYVFNYKSSCDGVLLRIAHLTHSGVGYYLPKASTLVAVYGKCTSGPDGKTFYIREDSVDKYNFDITDQKFSNTQLNIDIAAETMLQMFVESTGSPAKDPVFTVEIAWRYVA